MLTSSLERCHLPPTKKQKLKHEPSLCTPPVCTTTCNVADNSVTMVSNGNDNNSPVDVAAGSRDPGPETPSPGGAADVVSTKLCKSSNPSSPFAERSSSQPQPRQQPPSMQLVCLCYYNVATTMVCVWTLSLLKLQQKTIMHLLSIMVCTTLFFSFSSKES